MEIKCFCFGPFYENTYIVWDDNGLAAIIDPGCYTKNEKHELLDFISIEKLQVKRHLLTHAHIDHIFGCEEINNRFSILPQMHPMDLSIYESAVTVSRMYGLQDIGIPKPGEFLEEGQTIEFGTIRFDILFCPGHSPGSICFYAANEGLIFSGDVLFEGSIGRTDLPGGNYTVLMHSIKSKLLVLPKHVQVFSGHGPATTIGQEILTNPFLQ